LPATWVETRDIPVTELAKFPGNARRGNVAEIRKSLAANGQYRAIVVRKLDDDSLMILAGNHTYDALVAEGSPAVRCEVITCTDHEARKINLADNRLSDLALDDNDALVELLSYLDDDYAGTGYGQEDIDFLLGLKNPGTSDSGDGEGEGGSEPPGNPVPPGWAVIHVAVPPAIRDRWQALMADSGDNWVEDHDRVALIVTLAERAKASGLHLDLG
jgi:ParB-like chromosome segregation protein Spo0J